VNYFAWILGIGAGLAAAGVDYRLARVIAGACESVYMYAAMRWLVFRDTRGGQRGEASQDSEHPATSTAPADCPATRATEAPRE
jgi:hypothetical protein